GVSLPLSVNHGNNLTFHNTSVDNPEIPHESDILFLIVPENLFAAFSTGELMAILFIAIIIGMAMSTMIFSTDEKTRKYGDILNDFFEALNKMFYKILDGILLYAPIG